jgi:hypothetical protein
MKLYIDTNIYRLYVSSTSDIKSLEKLKKLIEQNKVELIFPSQTKKEFLKHFKEGVNKTKEKLKSVKTKVIIPNELKNDKYGKLTEQDKEITAKIDTLNTDLEKYRTQKITEFKKHIETVDKLLAEIFKLATFFECTDEVVLKAMVRYAKDLPPKKNDHKFGDAIIWETLKENIRGEEIVIITNDGDFAENKGKKGKVVIRKILDAEWKKHTGKKITLYNSLGQFVNTLDKEDKVSPETIKREAFQATAFVSVPRISMENEVIFGNHSRIPIITASGAFNTTSSIAGGNYALSALDLEKNSIVFSPNLSTATIAGNTFQSADSIATLLKSTCTRCRKSYTPSITALNINGWCDECNSKNNGWIY